MAVDPALPPSFAAVLADLENRVRTLESSNRLLSSAIKGGSLQVLDPNGQEVVHLGALVNGDGVTTAGAVVTLQPSDKQILWIDGENGIAYPQVCRQMDRDTYTPVTSAAFVSVHVGRTYNVPSDAVTIALYAYTDAGTVGELRCSHDYASAVNTPTSVRTISSTSSQELIWNWRHGIPIVGDATMHIEARRVSGAGNVYVGPCVSGMNFTSHVVNAATTTGV